MKRSYSINLDVIECKMSESQSPSMKGLPGRLMKSLSFTWGKAESSQEWANDSVRAAEVKRRWRKEQIANQQKMCSQVNATWRRNQIQCMWCGWMKKKSRGIAAQWHSRWFELVQDLIGGSSSRVYSAILQYENFGEAGSIKQLKRLKILDARREKTRDWPGWSCLSVAVAERKERVYLSMKWEGEVDALLSRIGSILALSESNQST